MLKFKKTVLILCLFFSGVLSYAHCEAGTGNGKEKGTPKITILTAHHGGTDRSNTITASLNGHFLTVVFTENIGQVGVEVTTLSGAVVQCISTRTPDGLQMYVPNAGDYIITFTLANGDEYYGEFTVTD